MAKTIELLGGTVSAIYAVWEPHRGHTRAMEWNICLCYQDGHVEVDSDGLETLPGDAPDEQIIDNVVEWLFDAMNGEDEATLRAMIEVKRPGPDLKLKSR